MHCAAVPSIVNPGDHKRGSSPLWVQTVCRASSERPLGPRKLIFAAEPDQAQNDLLTDEGVFSRLLSYHKFRDKDERFLERYMFEW